MYGLPKDFDAGVFIGRTLEMVGFTINQIYLHFDAGISIAISGDLVYRAASANADITLTPPVKTANFMDILEHKIVRAIGLQNGTLSLAFDNGDTIECVDTSDNYESYQISLSGQTIIV